MHAVATKTPSAKEPSPRAAPEGAVRRAVNPAFAAMATGGASERGSGCACGVQRKLTVGSSDDPLEREADAVADRGMRMPAGSAAARPSRRGAEVQRKCAQCESE